jgi:hypothetical protein
MENQRNNSRSRSRPSIDRQSQIKGHTDSVIKQNDQIDWINSMYDKVVKNREPSPVDVLKSIRPPS